MATITATLGKTKKGTYKADLEVTNNTTNTYTNWTISCDMASGVTIDKIKHFTVSGNILTPDSKIATLAPSDSIDVKFEGTGDNMPTNWIFIDGSGPSPTPTPSPTSGPTPDPSPTPSPVGPPAGVTIVYNCPMTNYSGVSDLASSGAGFTFQYSYDKMSGFSATSPNPVYFTISPENGLETNLYVGDKPFKKGSNTEPRTELRGLAVVKDDIVYTYSFDQYLVDLPGFDYAFCQVFGGNGPNLIFRWRSGTFQILSDQGNKQIVNYSGTPSDDVGKWVSYKVEFLLSKSKGYTKLYRDNVLMCTVNNGNNSGDNGSYIKHGIYSQQMEPTNNVKLYTKNLMLYY